MIPLFGVGGGGDLYFGPHSVGEYLRRMHFERVLKAYSLRPPHHKLVVEGQQLMERQFVAKRAGRCVDDAVIEEDEEVIPIVFAFDFAESAFADIPPRRSHQIRHFAAEPVLDILNAFHGVEVLHFGVDRVVDGGDQRVRRLQPLQIGVVRLGVFQDLFQQHFVPRHPLDGQNEQRLDGQPLKLLRLRLSVAIFGERRGGLLTERGQSRRRRTVIIAVILVHFLSTNHSVRETR